MKRILTLTIAALLYAAGMNAQTEGYDDTQHEVALMYGWKSNSQWLDAFESIAGAMFGEKTVNERFVGSISVEYFYRLKPWLGVGGTFSYGCQTKDMLDRNEDDVLIQVGDMTHNYFTLMPAVKMDWLRRRHFGMYSKLALGATLRDESINSFDETKHKSSHDTMVHVNWQVSLLGLEGGSEYWRVFAELGMGEQGILLGGLRYKF